MNSFFMASIILGLGATPMLSSAATPTHGPLENIQKASQELNLRTEQEAERTTSRWSHAKELLGAKYNKSIVKTGEKIGDMSALLTAWTSRALKGRWKKYARTVAETIAAESDKYGFDPVFLMAVIENESSFNPEVVGTSGEIGLMQVTLETGAWIAKTYGLHWKGKKTLRDPAQNIRIGAAYMAYLREEFDFQGQLYLAAYNMGSGNVRKALNRNVKPKEYSTRVMHRYLRFYAELQKVVSQRSFN